MPSPERPSKPSHRYVYLRDAVLLSESGLANAKIAAKLGISKSNK
jgi:hypothetical protein